MSRLQDIPDGGTLAVVLKDGERICLIRRGKVLTAVQNVCTHQEFEISAGDVLPDGTIQCAWHGARFDCETGEVKQIPATDPLPVFEVRCDGDTILVGPKRKRSGLGYEPSVLEVKA